MLLRYQAIDCVAASISPLDSQGERSVNQESYFAAVLPGAGA